MRDPGTLPNCVQLNNGSPVMLSTGDLLGDDQRVDIEHEKVRVWNMDMDAARSNLVKTTDALHMA